jgi:hypothetical protein
MDPNQTKAQAEALAATRRMLAREKLEILGDEEVLPGVFTGEDRTLLEGDSEEQRQEDLRIFEEWHRSLGTDPESALQEMRRRVYDRVMSRLPGSG